MNTILQGEVTVAFIMGGISKEKKKPYLQISNGLEKLFLKFDKNVEVNEDTFADLVEGDELTIEVRQRVGSSQVTLVGFN